MLSFLKHVILIRHVRGTRRSLHRFRVERHLEVMWIIRLCLVLDQLLTERIRTSLSQEAVALLVLHHLRDCLRVQSMLLARLRDQGRCVVSLVVRWVRPILKHLLHVIVIEELAHFCLAISNELLDC